jgi:hypothetical protein
MVWYYGGGDTQGSAADSTFDGASLTSRADVVVVTVNVRSRPSRGRHELNHKLTLTVPTQHIRVSHP